MKSTARQFPERAREALLDPDLKRALAQAENGFVNNRRVAVHF